jgi:hypothetical protein
VDGSELVRETQVNVIQKPRLVGTVVLGRVERLYDVLLASVPMLGCRRQVFHVDHEVLRPVLQILLRDKPVGVFSDPVWDVVGKPSLELVEVLRDDESVVPDVSAISDREGVGFVGPISKRQIGKIERLIVETCGIALHGDTP